MIKHKFLSHAEFNTLQKWFSDNMVWTEQDDEEIFEQAGIKGMLSFNSLIISTLFRNGRPYTIHYNTITLAEYETNLKPILKVFWQYEKDQQAREDMLKNTKTPISSSGGLYGAKIPMSSSAQYTTYTNVNAKSLMAQVNARYKNLQKAQKLATSMLSQVVKDSD